MIEGGKNSWSKNIKVFKQNHSGITHKRRLGKILLYFVTIGTSIYINPTMNVVNLLNSNFIKNYISLECVFER